MPTGVYERTEKHKKTCFKKGQIPWNKGKHPEYVQGKNHPMFGIRNFGENNPNWKGGKAMHSKGYIWIISLGHPYRDEHNRVLEHRLVVEKQIGRYLLPKETVHHLGNKDDNLPQMLMAFVNQSAHKRFEKGGIVKPEEIIFDGRELKEERNENN